MRQRVRGSGVWKSGRFRLVYPDFGALIVGGFSNEANRMRETGENTGIRAVPS
jgi:hypothetical protein